MKGAVIVSKNQEFVEWAANILKERGYRVDLRGDALQVSDGGRLLTFYSGSKDISDLLPEVDTIQGCEVLKSMNYACLVDCRWEDLFCQTMKDLAGAALDEFAVIDNRGVLLKPSTLDPLRISL